MDTPLAPEVGIDTPDISRELAIQRLKLKQDFKGIAAAGVLAAIVAVVIWAVGEGGYFWPAWVMVLGAIPIVVQAWKAYGPANRISEDDVQREMGRDRLASRSRPERLRTPKASMMRFWNSPSSSGEMK